MLNYSTEICHGEGKNNRVGFGAEISSAANEPRKIVNLFPVMVSRETKTSSPSVLTVKGSSYQP